MVATSPLPLLVVVGLRGGPFSPHPCNSLPLPPSLHPHRPLQCSDFFSPAPTPPLPLGPPPLQPHPSIWSSLRQTRGASHPHWPTHLCALPAVPTGSSSSSSSGIVEREVGGGGGTGWGMRRMRGRWGRRKGVFLGMML